MFDMEKMDKGGDRFSWSNVKMQNAVVFFQSPLAKKISEIGTVAMYKYVWNLKINNFVHLQ